MEPKNKKKMTIKKRGEKNSNYDRLSSLPDSVLSHIFSFLDTRSAIRTSVLSKRFQLLWTISPTLEFELKEIPVGSLKSYTVDGNSRENSDDSPFELYVNRVLERREHINLTSFSLEMYHYIRSEFVEKCIDYAARHKVQNLSIRAFVKYKPVVLPKMLINSSSLITMRLKNTASSGIELPRSVLLPNLKVLALRSFEFTDTNYNGELFSGCPCLEDLILNRCCVNKKHGVKPRVLDVNCPKLRNLEIRYWRSPWKYFDECMINMNAPELLCFKFVGHLVRMNFKERLSSLKRAVVDLCYPTACSMVDVVERLQRTGEVFISMLRHVSSAKVLFLSPMTIEVLSAVPDLRVHSPIMFENLKFIKFIAHDKYAETTLPISTVRQLLEKVKDDTWIFFIPKELRQKKRKDATRVCVPAVVMHYLLESSPSAESLCIEIPKVSTDRFKVIEE